MMGYRIFITSPGLAVDGRQLLRDEGCDVQVGAGGLAPEAIAQALTRFRPDGLILRSGKMTRDVMGAAETLKAICKYGVGTDNIDIDGATSLSIPVTYTPFALAEPMAEHTLALILGLLRRVALQDRRVRAGESDKSTYDGVELRGKTLGLVGFGRSARRLCELVAPFEVTVVTYDPVCDVEQLPDHVRKATSLGQVLSEAEVLSLHCPLTDETRNLINARTIAAMTRGVYFVNTARAGLVNESDLLAALRDGQVAGAALDVFDVEPPTGPLLELDNVILSPHVAGMSDVASARTGLDAVRSILALLRGEPVDESSLLNPSVYTPRTSAP